MAFLLLFGLLPAAICFGQSKGARGFVSFGAASGLADDTLYLDVNQDIAVQLMPFDELMKVAISHSPLIKYQNEVANSLSSAHDLSRLQILQNISASAGYNAGNQFVILSGGGVTPGRENTGQIANGGRVGVDVRLPLYELFGGRKHQVRQAYSNYRAALIQKEAIELQLKRELITIYQDMITAQQLLKIRLSDEQASLAALRIAEVEIQKGQITADMMANATSRYVQTKTATEQTKGDFLKNVHYFEALMGMNIKRLKRN